MGGWVDGWGGDGGGWGREQVVRETAAALAAAALGRVEGLDPASLWPQV